MMKNKKMLMMAALMIAAPTFCPIVAQTQNGSGNGDSGVSLKKYVTGPDNNGQYLITLEAYAKGSSISTITEEVQPTDIIVVMDYSSSMTSNNVSVTATYKAGDEFVGETGKDYTLKKNGNQYILRVFTETRDLDTYSPLDSREYSYNSYGDNTYYYKDGDNYYPVSRTTGSGSWWTTYYRLSYNDNNGTTHYLSVTGTTTTAPTNVTSGNGTIWSGVLYTRDTETVYYYRYGTSRPANKTSGNELYTGTTGYIVQDTEEIYISETMTRLAAAKKAAIKFVETVYKNSPAAPVGGGTQEYHKLAVVRFSTAQNTGTLVNLQDVTSSSYTSIQNTINNYNTTGNGTLPYEGFNVAGTILSGIQDDGRKKIVVFFTDGVPSSDGRTFNADYARRSVSSAYTLKYTYDATVFSVALLGEADMANVNMRRFLHYVSSNYNFDVPTSGSNLYTFASDHPSATCQIEGHTTWHGSEDPHDYYQLSNGSDLTAIFDKIAQEASSGGASIKLSAETTTVLDVLTADFVLPENADINSIGLYVDEVTGFNTTSEAYSFGNRTNLVPSGASRSDYVSFEDAVIDGKTTKKISVTGFDFTKEDTPANGEILYGNWVGPRQTSAGGVTSTVYKGKRLVITIPIEPAPDYQGGYSLPTNSGESGIYVKDSDTPIEVFPIPDLDFPSIGIIKRGLAKGESATFTVQRIKSSTGADVSDNPYMVILTGNETGTPVYTVLKDLPEGTYRVAESKWSWTYDVTEVTISNGTTQSSMTPGSEEATVTTQILAKSQTTDWPSGITETVKCVLFDFTNVKKSGDDGTIYSEAVARNKFSGENFSEGSSTTINSKPQPGEEAPDD